MRPVLPIVLVMTLVPAVFAARPSSLTIVLDFDGPYSQWSVDEMKREAQAIMRDSGLTLDWRLRSEVGGESFPNLVMVRFKGACILQPGDFSREDGPLAFSYTTDGAILPFSEVECRNVTASVQSAMFDCDYAHADLLLGRALGRVLAHELVHILCNSGGHAKEGGARAVLSGSRLIRPEFRLDAKTLERLQAQHQDR